MLLLLYSCSLGHKMQKHAPNIYYALLCTTEEHKYMGGKTLKHRTKNRNITLCIGRVFKAVLNNLFIENPIKNSNILGERLADDFQKILTL